MLDLTKINGSWTLFLDRDGVLNHDKQPYTLNAGQFELYDGVTEAMKLFNSVFKYIIIVTNQRGVGRNLMTEQDLSAIHQKMLGLVESAGGRIDKIYYCSSIDDEHPNRKPNPGMALDAMREFPLISPEQALIVGNNISDMQFGRNAGIKTVLLNTTDVRVDLPHPLVDLQYNTLIEFANALKAAL